MGDARLLRKDVMGGDKSGSVRLGFEFLNWVSAFFGPFTRKITISSCES